MTTTPTAAAKLCECGAPVTAARYADAPYGDCDDCEAEAEAAYEAGIEGELAGEFAMNWVMGGGAVADIGAAYAQYR